MLWAPARGWGYFRELAQPLERGWMSPVQRQLGTCLSHTDTRPHTLRVGVCAGYSHHLTKGTELGYPGWLPT